MIDKEICSYRKNIIDSLKEVTKFAIAEGKLLEPDDYMSSAINLLHGAYIELIISHCKKNSRLKILNTLYEVGASIIDEASKNGD